jgi:hypothetical protein
MMMIRFAIAMACFAVLNACAPSAPPPSSEVRIPADIRDEAPPFELAQPNVVVEADPPPPFTYWAPEGAVIRNHGNPGLWVAYLDGRSVEIYFGDQCRASEWQHFVGQPLGAVPEPPAGISVRTSCSTCATTDDLRPDRINVVFDESSQRVVEIACH